MPAFPCPSPLNRPARRSLQCVAAILTFVCLPAGAGPARCDTLAGSTLRWIVPNNPGGGYDADARLLQPFVEKELRATIVIENRPEAGGLVGAAAIRDAAPNGRTIGIINASGLLAAGMDQDTPNPIADFTILARLLSNRIVVVTGRDSGIGSLDELLRLSAQRPIVIGVRDAGSASVFVVPVVAALLGIDYELVAGYVGNSARALAAIRGEVDLLVQNLDSVQRFIADGELRPLLQVTGARPGKTSGPNDAMLAGVPTLGGQGGVAQQRALVTGRTREQALKQAQALAALIDAGRVIVAPPAMPDGPRGCLESALGNVLTSPEFRSAAARAKLGVEPADAATARNDIRLASEALVEFSPLVRAAMQRARQ